MRPPTDNITMNLLKTATARPERWPAPSSPLLRLVSTATYLQGVQKGRTMKQRLSESGSWYPVSSLAAFPVAASNLTSPPPSLPPVPITYNPTNDHIKKYHEMQTLLPVCRSVSDACQCRRHNDLGIARLCLCLRHQPELLCIPLFLFSCYP